MADDVALVDDVIEVETPPRKRGRPPKPTPDNPDGALIASDAPNPRYKTYDTNSPNKNQKTNAAWAWWNSLSPAVKQIIELNVYRDWPVMLEPLDESDRKEIGLILGIDPVQTDQDFVDRFGAGDYRAYLNVSPKGDSKRTLFTAYVKCTHAFREFPPSDHRIDDVSKVDVSDKSNRSYVAWLKATGKLKTGLQMVGIPAILIYKPIAGVPVYEIGVGLLWVSVVLSLISGYQYVQLYVEGRRGKPL